MTLSTYEVALGEELVVLLLGLFLSMEISRFDLGCKEDVPDSICLFTDEVGRLFMLVDMFDIEYLIT